MNECTATRRLPPIIITAQKTIFGHGVTQALQQFPWLQQFAPVGFGGALDFLAVFSALGTHIRRHVGATHALHALVQALELERLALDDGARPKG